MISWMYGELDENERAKVEAYFSEHPEELKEVQQLQSVRDVMSRAADKEVIAPPVVPDHEQRTIPIWRASYFRVSMSIAASFILILVAGRLLGPEISYSNNELRISFGAPKTAETVPEQIAIENIPGQAGPDSNQDTDLVQASLTEAEIQEMINASLRSSEERIGRRLTSAQSELDKTVRTALASAPAEIDSLAERLSKASERQVRAFVTSLRDENLSMMRQYLDLSASAQRAYMENLLVDFSKWQQEQRSQDLQILLTRVNSIENNTNQLKEETEQILASIISNTGISIKQSN